MGKGVAKDNCCGSPKLPKSQVKNVGKGTKFSKATNKNASKQHGK